MAQQISSPYLLRLFGQGKLLENLTSPDKSSETTISSSLFCRTFVCLINSSKYNGEIITCLSQHTC